MNFGEKIKKLRIENSWTQEYVAERLKISIPALSRYESGTYEPKSLSIVSDFAKLYNVTTDYLLGLDLEFNDKNSSKTKDEPNIYVLDLYNSLSSQNQLETVRYMRYLKSNNNYCEPKIQILGQTAAGKPIEYGDSYAQDIDDVSNIPKNADYALVVNGDSMEPLIKNGQLIYVRETPDVENGEIAVVEIDGAVTCKKVYKWSDHIELQSINTAYEPMIITSGNFRILGKVIVD